MADDGKPLALPPFTIIEGFLEHVMIHETRSPLLRGWNGDESLRAMRMMRMVIENRSHAPRWFGASGHKPGVETEFAVLRAPGQYGPFANAPNFPHGFIQPVHDILSAANDPKAFHHDQCRTQVLNAITAATEAAPPADLINPRLYYWRTAGSAGPAGKHNPAAAKHLALVVSIQNADFYTQDNINPTQ